jgi:hypothetical protein
MKSAESDRVGKLRLAAIGPVPRDSTTYAEPAIGDYAERTKETIAAWRGTDGKQGGDPAKLAMALVQLAGLETPPARFAAGVDAMQTFDLLAQADAHRALSSSLSHDEL